MVVVKVVYQDVADKVDTQYIESELADVENVGIVYVCVPEGGEEDDWIDDKTGMRKIIIHLPYKQVKKFTDAKPLMLAKAKERLGIVA